MVFFNNKFRNILSVSLVLVMMLSFTVLFAHADYEVESAAQNSEKYTPPGEAYFGESGIYACSSYDYGYSYNSDFLIYDVYCIDSTDGCELDGDCEIYCDCYEAYCKTCTHCENFFLDEILDASITCNNNRIYDEKGLRAAFADAANMDEQVTIVLMADITLSSSLRIPTNANIILTGTHTLSTTSTQPVIIVDGAFTLNGPTITRDPGTLGIESRGVFVNADGKFIMKSGIIENHASEAINPGPVVGRGGGIFVNGGTFVMHGGYIRHNEAIRSFASGGGVFINNGIFEMHGGTISDNSAWGGNTGIGGGGVAIFNNSKFDMYGGYIRNNRSGINASGAGNTNTGGGVSIGANSTFTLHNGNISGNWVNGRGGGVYTHWSIAGGTGYMGMNNHFVMHGGTISNNTAFRHPVDGGSAAGSGGGVFIGNNTSTFVMHGGKIGPNNRATHGGGGIYSRNAEVIIYSGGVVLSNVTYTSGGGIQMTPVPAHASGGTPARAVSLRGGRIIENQAVLGGGGINVQERTLNMFSGEITGNKTIGAGTGGGVNLISSATFIMHNGTISENISATRGGGVAVMSPTSEFTMNNNAVIRNNTANAFGGGVYTRALVTMNNGEIRGNTANYGGGVFASTNSNGVFIANAGSITNNHANFDGGGIFTTNYLYENPLLLLGEYTNLVIANTVVFGNNTAQASFKPPSNAASLTNIGFSSTSILTHPLNNFDINHRGTPHVYTVTYYPDGGINTPVDSNSPYLPNSTVTVLGQGNMTRDGYTFAGWRKSNVGELWQAGSTFTINNNTRFYAQWELIPTPPPEPPPESPPEQPSEQPSGQLPESTPEQLSEQPSEQSPAPADSTPQLPPNSALDRHVFVERESELPDSGSGDVPIGAYGTRNSLFAPLRTASWSLLSLILTILGVLLGIVTLVRALMKKRHEEEDDEDVTMKHFYEDTEEEEEPPIHKHRKLCLLLVGLMAILGVIVFLFFNDIRTPVVLINIWTILNVIVFAIELIAIILKRKPLKDEEDEQEQLAASTTGE